MKFGIPPTALIQDNESAYSAASSQMSARLERLEDLIASLSHRLTPMLDPICHEPAAHGDQAEKFATSSMPAPLVAALEHHAIRADKLSNEVSELLSRLCL